VTAAKICGLTRAGEADHAIASGASYIGAILAGGPRRLDVVDAARVLGARRAGVLRVAVFGHDTSSDIAAIARELDVDVAQLHGDPSVEDIRVVQERAGCIVWPVVRVEGTVMPPEAMPLAAASGWLVLDAKVAGQLGGTGARLEWAGLAMAVRALRTAVPGMRLVLAGGLRPANVKEAISLLDPDVVDVSSGVERSPGVKDPVLVTQFVTAAGAAREQDA
jgi:phosphoribosylanthranilate isomerase